LIGLRDHGHVDAEVRKVAASIDGALGFKTTMVFPTAGRWKLWLIAGRHRFNLPTLSVGTGEAPKDWVAFPVGSYAARQGGGGELVTGSGAGTTSWWLFPLAGVVIAGAGVATIRARR